MKILIIRNFPSYIDVKFNTYNIQEIGLAKALIRCGNKVDIVFWTNKEEKTEKIKFDNNLSVTVFYKKGKNILKNAWYTNIDNLIADYDVIQSCEYNQIQSWYWSKKYRNKLIIYHGPYFSKFNKRYNLICKIFDTLFLKRYIKLNTKFIVKSNLAKDFLEKKGIKNDNISMIGVGIDTEVLFTNSKNKSQMYEEMKQQSKDTIKLLYIGKVEPRRDPLFIVDILKELLKNKIEAHLYIIGNGDDSNIKEMENYINSNQLANRVTWQRKCEQKYLSRIYQTTDVFLLPTKYEIFGMVLLEAMYYGCLVFTTSNGGSSLLISNEKNGFILDERDAVLWASKIAKVVKNKKLKEKISLNAHIKIEKEYLWDNLVPKFIDSYKKVK